MSQKKQIVTGERRKKKGMNNLALGFFEARHSAILLGGTARRLFRHEWSTHHRHEWRGYGRVSIGTGHDLSIRERVPSMRIQNNDQMREP